MHHLHSCVIFHISRRLTISSGAIAYTFAIFEDVYEFRHHADVQQGM